ncbi:MAG TPA: Plug domain-containing protein, partial [Nannocystis sp.]
MILGVIAIVVAPGSARAQVPPTPPDTVARDTVVVDTAGAAADSVGMVRDTVAAADTLRPVDVVHRFPRGAAPSWRAGVWEWDRAALHASGATTLTDLLEGIPGVHALRFGLDASPEALSAWGMGGGRLEIVLDGFVLDPLDAGTFDLSRLELVAVERVRV